MIRLGLRFASAAGCRADDAEACRNHQSRLYSLDLTAALTDSLHRHPGTKPLQGAARHFGQAEEADRFAAFEGRVSAWSGKDDERSFVQQFARLD